VHTIVGTVHRIGYAAFYRCDSPSLISYDFCEEDLLQALPS